MQFEDKLPEEIQVFDSWVKQRFSEEAGAVVGDVTVKREEHIRYVINYLFRGGLEITFYVAFRGNDKKLYVDTPDIDTNQCIYKLADTMYEFSEVLKFLEESQPITLEDMKQELTTNAL